MVSQKPILYRKHISALSDLSKHDGIYSTTGFSLDDVSFGKYACASSGDSLVMSGLPKVQDVKTRKSRSVNTGYIFTILHR